MGKTGCHHNHHLHQETFYNKTTFLPLLCRVSIRDVRLRDRDRSTSLSGDPSSPKVSCMGQVKKNHQLIDFPTPYRLTMTAATATAGEITSKPNSNRGHFKYTKLKKLFSGKNLLTTTAAAATAATTSTAAASDNRSRSCREMIMRRNGSRRSSKINNDDDSDHHGYRGADNQVVNLNINELDPPLPVTKKVPQPSEINLWKRRSGGLALGNLQIEQIHAPKNMYNYHSVTTV